MRNTQVEYTRIYPTGLTWRGRLKRLRNWLRSIF